MAPNPVAPSQPFVVIEATEQPDHPRPTSAAVCPICSTELYEKREELGALTHQERRMELSLYHSSCITMMLAHAGALLRGPRSGAESSNYEISWGLSPVSRKPVDGFLRMPSLLDQRGWVSFVDWRSTGCIDVEDLATVIAAMLPIEEQDSVRYVHERFHANENGYFSQGELSRQVLPHLEKRCKELCTGKRTPLCEFTPFMDAVDGLRLMPSASDWFSLRTASSRCAIVVTVILAHELCHFLQERVRLQDLQLHTHVSVVAAALGSLAAKGNSEITSFLASLLESDDDELQKLACDQLPRVINAEDKLSFSIVTARLEHPSPPVRVAAITAVTAIASPGWSYEAVLSKMGDQETCVRAAAVRALGELSEKGDQAAIREIVGQIVRSRSKEAQKAAEDTLPLVAKGDEHTIELFCRELMHEDEEVCLQAMRVLGLIAEVGDKRVVEALLAFCRPQRGRHLSVLGRASQAAPCSSVKVKCAAIAGLGKVVAKGDKSVLNAVLPPLLESSDPQILEAGIRLIGCIGTPGDKVSLKTLAYTFSDKFGEKFQGPHYRLQNIRQIALEMIQQVSIGGHEASTEIVMPLFKSRDLELRRRAVVSMPLVAKQGDCRAIRALKEVLSSETDVHVKNAAQSSLAAMGEPVYESNLRVCFQMCSCFVLALVCTAVCGLFLSGLYHLMQAVGFSFGPSVAFSCLIIFTFILILRFRKRLVRAVVDVS